MKDELCVSEECALACKPHTHPVYEVIDNNKTLQFARLIYEMYAAGVFNLIEDEHYSHTGDTVRTAMLESMDLSWGDIIDIVNKATEEFEAFCERQRRAYIDGEFSY